MTFFSSRTRTLDTEASITLTSVGVDIGSSTSHLVFSRIVMERRESVYVVASREVLFESDVILTPYKNDTTIDADALQPFIERQYRHAGIATDDVDAGALILTGVAARRSNARAIGELFAHQAGKFVAVSAGDSLETSLVACGSGAVALSAVQAGAVMNVDIGGGTSKIALCEAGSIVDRTVVDLGARVVRLDDDGRVVAVEDSGRRLADIAGVELSVGQRPADGALTTLAERIADLVFEAMRGEPPGETLADMLRLAPLAEARVPEVLTFSGGVAEFLYARETGSYGDLGPLLAAAMRRRAADWGPELRVPRQGIRATVIGASQYTVQVSGSTILVAPTAQLPLRNVAAISPELPLQDERLDARAIAAGVAAAVERIGWRETRQPLALFFRWQGSATYRRLEDFCTGIIDGLEPVLAAGLPMILVTDSDVAGLVGLHCLEVKALGNPLVSIDGIVAREFDFIDIGEFLAESGAVPVVVKSLVFPSAMADNKLVASAR